MRPCEGIHQHAIKTHDHNFLTLLHPPLHSLSLSVTHIHACVLPPRPVCLWTSSVNVFAGDGWWIAPLLLLLFTFKPSTSTNSSSLASALPLPSLYCHHCHSNPKNIWGSATIPQHWAKNSSCVFVSPAPAQVVTHVSRLDLDLNMASMFPRSSWSCCCLLSVDLFPEPLNHSSKTVKKLLWPQLFK